MKKKLCIVIQRYGVEIVGGAETYCRVYAEKLCKLYDVEVLTTTALDYQSWANYYPEGITEINGVKVRRFFVDIQRDPAKFEQLYSQIIKKPNHSLNEAHKWIVAQGPVSNGLINYIIANKDVFSIFIFMTYLYYHTAIGLPYVKEKSILIPFAHNEPPVYIKTYEQIFTNPKGIIYNTEEEMIFIQNLFKNRDIPSILTGIGLDIPPHYEFLGKASKFKLDFPYILYMGRIDPSKGCIDLINYFQSYKRLFKNDLKLVLIGSELFNLPRDKNIISLGFVSEHEKYAVLDGSIALVLPSHFESLSIVVLEALALNKPVLVSGHCEVLKGHCTKSDGGLYFYGEVDFIDCLDLLLNNPELRNSMGANGIKYVEKNYQWNVILEKLTRFINDFI